MSRRWEKISLAFRVKNILPAPLCVVSLGHDDPIEIDAYFSVHS